MGILARGTCMAVAVVGIANLSIAQDPVHWVPRTPPDFIQHAMATDTDRRVVVLFGGINRENVADNQTWEYVWKTQAQPPRQEWIRRFPANSPPPRSRHAMAYDASRQVTVMFGGTGSGGESIDGLFQDTWEWDGTNWTQIPTLLPNWPDQRDEHAMTYDATAVPPSIVMHGGRNALGPGTPPPASLTSGLSDTWTYNGTWTDVSTSPSVVGAKLGHAMAHDDLRGYVVMFGTSQPRAVPGRTWIWSGNPRTWSQLATSNPPADPFQRNDHVMEFSPLITGGSMIMHGGSVNQGAGLVSRRTWALFFGTLWLDITQGTLLAPSARTGHAAAPDPRNPLDLDPDPLGSDVIVFGGRAAVPLEATSDFWRSRPNVWIEQTPQMRAFHAQTYDSVRQQTVLFGWTKDSTTNLFPFPAIDTWLWDGTSWTAGPSSGPEQRQNPAMVFDSQQGMSVLFGGQLVPGNAVRNDTWLWNGSAWTLAIPHDFNGMPTPRRGHAMAYDSQRGLTVMFGGADSGGQTVGNGTWEWNGIGAWNDALPPTRPPERMESAMAYDSLRGCTVLFGGRDGSTRFGDTWEWDGSDWTQLTPFPSPSPRHNHGMTYDVHRRLTILTGGVDATGQFLNDTWTWDGADWTLQTSLQNPSPRAGAPISYDSSRGRVVMFGGEDPETTNPHAGDTWELALTVDTGPAIPSFVAPIIAENLPVVGRQFNVNFENFSASTPSLLFGLLGQCVPQPNTTSPLVCGPFTLFLNLASPTMATTPLPPLPTMMNRDRWAVTIPNLPGLVGMRFCLQGLTNFDSVANCYLATNGLDVTIINN